MQEGWAWGKCEGGGGGGGKGGGGGIFMLAKRGVEKTFCNTPGSDHVSIMLIIQDHFHQLN